MWLFYLSHDKRLPIKQAGFNGKYPTVFCFLAYLFPWDTKHENEGFEVWSPHTMGEIQWNELYKWRFLVRMVGCFDFVLRLIKLFLVLFAQPYQANLVLVFFPSFQYEYNSWSSEPTDHHQNHQVFHVQPSLLLPWKNVEFNNGWTFSGWCWRNTLDPAMLQLRHSKKKEKNRLMVNQKILLSPFVEVGK